MGTDRHGKFNYHGVWMQQIAPMPVHLIFDESFRASGCIGGSFCCWDVVHGNHYNWSEDNPREVEKRAGSRRQAPSASWRLSSAIPPTCLKRP
jgi:hypothetical protein